MDSGEHWWLLSFGYPTSNYVLEWIPVHLNLDPIEEFGSRVSSSLFKFLPLLRYYVILHNSQFHLQSYQIFPSKSSLTQNLWDMSFPLNPFSELLMKPVIVVII